MTKTDKDEIRELINDILATHNATIEGKFILINEILMRIETQTIKTNGRVNKLETNEAQHVINCPVISRVNKLEENQTYKKGQFRMLAIISTSIATITALIISVAAIYFNK